MIVQTIDFETRSRLNLKLTNAYKYARHPSTEVLCLSEGPDTWDVVLWEPGEPFPFDDFDNMVFEAFNAEFELEIWNHVCVPKYGWPRLDPSRISCLQARCAYAGLPRKLEMVSAPLGLGVNAKDAEGHKVMQRLSKPHGGKSVGCEIVGGKFDDDPAKHERNGEYCVRDTVAECLVGRFTRPLPVFEQQLWQVHQRINTRGVPVDLDLCRNVTRLVQMENERLSDELQAITGGAVEKPTQLQRLKEWAEGQGAKLGSLQEDILNEHLKLGTLPEKVIRALEIRKLSRDASVAKFDTAINHADEDGRCRGAHVFYKAGPGRFAGAGVNFLNLRRLNEDELDDLLELADEISGTDDLMDVYHELMRRPAGVIPTLGKMPRLMVKARPGHKLVVCDYTAIEMRVLHWLAGDAAALKAIREFDQGIGEEPYKLSAARIFKKDVADVTKAERQIGKVQILGCGYMTGANKFKMFCEGYGIPMDDGGAHDIVRDYRQNNPLVVRLWYDLGRAAVSTVKDRERRQVGLVQFYMRGRSLCVRLPSGREIRYFDAKVVEGLYGEEIEALDQRSGARKAVGLPILIENIDQGTSRDLLADALIKCDAAGLPVVLHVYDEIVIEVPEFDDESGKLLQQIMVEPPAWARGLPIAAKPGEGVRYIK